LPTTPGRATLPAPVRPAISLTQRALELHERAVVIDAHCDIAQAMCDDGLDIGAPRGTTHFSLSRARRGGLAAEFFALFVAPDEYPGPAAWRRTLALMRVVKLAARVHPAHFGIARTAAEIRAHHAAGRVAGILAVEGAHGLGARTERRIRARIAVLAERGVRSFGLTWNNSNALATAAAAPVDHGLSPLGGIAVRDLERLGVLVDVSHASDRTVSDVLAGATRPIIASHSNARALCPVPRNLPDGLLREIGAQGGVVCANFFAGFLDVPTHQRLQRLKAAHAARAARAARRHDGPARRTPAERRHLRAACRRLPQVPLARLVAHLVHLAAVAGPAHVGLGSDFDGMMMPVAGLADVAALPRLTEALRPHFDDAEILGILGGNVLRLLDVKGG
jgi:membrane dipeptidase